jgi:hypothetical protein
VKHADKVALAILAVLFAAGPTPGDIGGCGHAATDLNVATFAAEKKSLDCQECMACGLSSDRCKRACDLAQPSEVAIPSSCRPLAQDGDVCIHALEASSCSDYAGYMSDVAPEVPTECEFCRDLDASVTREAGTL